MGIEPNISNNPSTIDTLWGTARQITDLCPGGGDLKNLTGYYQHQRLLWLKQYIDNTLQHLQRCVKEFPTLHWLPYKTVYRTVASMYEQLPQRMTLPANVPKELRDLPNNNMEDKNNPALSKIPPGLRDLLRVFSGR